MQKITSKLTVFFEDPFWVGVYEIETGGILEVCKITFGSEPKTHEVYDFLLQNWSKLRFSPPVTAADRSNKHINPKRLQRSVKRQLETEGIGTKSQQALKLQQEAKKELRKKSNFQKKQIDKQRKFELRQQKRLKKHRGH